jgi:hypothetical protein
MPRLQRCREAETVSTGVELVSADWKLRTTIAAPAGPTRLVQVRGRLFSPKSRVSTSGRRGVFDLRRPTGDLPGVSCNVGWGEMRLTDKRRGRHGQAAVSGHVMWRIMKMPVWLTPLTRTRCESVLGQGCCFWFRLPAYPEPTPPIDLVPKEVLHTRARERLLEHFLSVVLRPGRMPPLTSQSDFELFDVRHL